MIPVAAELIDWLADLLVQAVWIATAVALPAWAVLRRVRDPRTAHHVALVALLLITFGLVTVGISLWPTAPATAVAAEPWVQGGSQVLQIPSAPASAVMTTAPRETFWTWREFLVAAWCAGVFGMSLRHAVGWWFAVRLRQTATLIEGELAQRFSVLCQTMGMSTPLLLASARIAVPAAIGWWRRAVLVPVGLMTGLPPAQIDALLLHELAHLRRYDWLAEMLVSLLESALFFHPAVWWLGRSLRQAREQCCDVQALRAGAHPEGLTRALVALAERTVPHSPVLAATGGMLANRVRRILGLPERRERPWRALAAIALLPLLLLVFTACATAVSAKRAATSPLAPETLSYSVSSRDFPLTRRIRAHADGRQVHTTIRTITAPIAFWKDLGIDGDRPIRLDPGGVTRVLDAAAAAQLEVSPRSITTFALQSAHFVFMNQQSYIADYRQVDGPPDPILSVISHGWVFDICAEPVSDGVVLAEAHYSSTDFLGADHATFPWPGDGIDKPFPFHMPVVVVEEGQAEPNTRLGPGEVLALPLNCRVQRASPPTFRHAREHATITTRIADPDLQARPRQVCLISVEAVQSSQVRRFEATPAAAWLDTTRVTLDLHQAPLDTAVTLLASQLPVPVEVARDDGDYAATRVDLIAQDEPARVVLDRVLAQCLLDGTADGERLRLAPRYFADYPRIPSGSKGSAPLSFATLPGPAWETAILKRYDVRDLILRAPGSSSEPGRQGSWTITRNPPLQSGHFVDTSDAAAALREAVFPATWIAERTVEGDTADGVVINAAPAVHNAIAAELTRRRATSDQVHLHLELVRLGAGTWTALGLGEATPAASLSESVHFTDDDLHRRIRAVASAARDQPAAIELTIGDNLSVEVEPDPASWWSGISFTLQPLVSNDRRYVTLTVSCQWPGTGPGETVRITRSSITVSDGSGFLISGPDESALLIHADVKPTD